MQTLNNSCKRFAIFLMGATMAIPIGLQSAIPVNAEVAPVNAATSASSPRIATPSPAQPRFFCDRSTPTPLTMARRSDGFSGPIIDWAAAWTALSNPPLSLNERCEEVANRLRVIQSRGSFRITAGFFGSQPALCVALERGVCASDGLIMTTRSIQAAEEGVRTLEASFRQLASAKNPASGPLSVASDQIATATPVPGPIVFGSQGIPASIDSQPANSQPANSQPANSQPISTGVRFSFQNVFEYSNCLEDIIQLYQDPERLVQQGRRGNCLPEVFSTYASQGLSQAQALEVIKAANQYALNASAGRWLFPPAGLRIRIQQLFGFTYAIDDAESQG